MSEFSNEKETAIRLARDAGRIILPIYATDFSVAFKGVGDPVTEADQRANELIVDGLRQAFPHDTIVAEESPSPLRGSASGRVWYVDPIDGTHEFIQKNGEFSVMIGLAIDGRSCLGVVYRPDSDILFGGLTDGEAWVEERGDRRPLAVSNRRDLQSLRLVVSRSHRHARVTQMRDHLGIHQETRCGSVGLKIARIAKGLADLYIEPSPYTSVWDACGPEAIMRGAGGAFTDLLGHPIVYGTENLNNNRGLVATNGACHDRVIAEIAPFVHELGLEENVEGKT